MICTVAVNVIHLNQNFIKKPNKVNENGSVERTGKINCCGIDPGGGGGGGGLSGEWTPLPSAFRKNIQQYIEGAIITA